MTLVRVENGIPSVDLSPGGEADRATLARFSEEACAALAEHGCIRLLSAFPAEQMLALRKESDRRHARYFPEAAYADARNQGDRRTLVTLEIEGGFGRPDFYANPRVYAIAAATLGAGFILGHLAVILSRPGSADQFIHRDTPSLFNDSSYDAFMPTVGLAMVLPLVSLNGVNGGTRVWPGTHRVASDDEARAMPSAVVELPIGGCLLFDVRLMHGGKGNASDEMRSIVYGAYHRKWFRDWDGFENQAPIGISQKALRDAPPELRHLFEWRFDKHLGWRGRNILDRALAFLPQPVLSTMKASLRTLRR